MILSHKHQFIFIKNKKTASTSMEIALSKYCGEADVITDIQPRDEQKRQELGHRGPQNQKVPLRHFSVKDLLQSIYLKRRIRFWNHCSAEFVKRHVDRRVWQDYYKFCFERNPWDKTISKYNFRKHYKKQDLPPINEFVQSGGIYEYSDFDLYSINNRIAVDEVFKYEQMEEALETLAEKIGLPELPELPRSKEGIRKHKKHYREILDETSRDIISKAFAREIAHFDYSW